MLDEIELIISAGNGGSGAVGFRRERYVPRGGPDGGDGGRGGNVVIRADTSIRVLDALRRRKQVKAEAGRDGGPAKKHGRNGGDAEIVVPVGTIVWSTGAKVEQLVDLCEVGASVVLASGGAGGRGNARLSTATRRAPHIAEYGLPGERRRVRLELRLLAEVGLVGLPNAGKSSLLRVISEAKPKVGAYPFTTLEPHLGIVERGYEAVVVADIPGLIEGAHEGAGLGIQFLRHVRRTRVLVHLVDASEPDSAAAISTVREELAAFGHGLADKVWMIALTKLDLPVAQERRDELLAMLAPQGVDIVPISARTGEGLDELLTVVFLRVRQEAARAAAEAPTSAPIVLRPPVVRPVKVVQRAGAYEVRGKRPVEVILRLGVASEEARAEVARRLRRLGVMTALRRAGVADGDTVRIGKAELKWPL